MGFFSKMHRFREAGDRPNAYNVEQYGEPAYSLFTTSKPLSLHQKTDITDDRERVLYQAQSKLLSLRDKTDITTADGRPVAHVERKVFSLHQRHFITMADGRTITLSTELMHLVRDITNIEELGWQLRGNLLGLNFALLDADGAPIAVIGQKMLSLHDKYCVDIYQPEHEPTVVAILVTLQHMMRDRQNNATVNSSHSD